jgi:hypothetical protein
MLKYLNQNIINKKNNYIEKPVIKRSQTTYDFPNIGDHDTLLDGAFGL